MMNEEQGMMNVEGGGPEVHGSRTLPIVNRQFLIHQSRLWA
jgi:hypothetical protein